MKIDWFNLFAWVMKRLCRGRGLLLAAAWLASGGFVRAQSPITNVSYWRLGENDIGAVNGAAATNLTDIVGGHNLTVAGPAAYSRDTAPSAFAHTGSTSSIDLTNGAYASGPIVSTVANNFGIEAWVKPGTNVISNQIIAYNGSTATSGWGIYMSSSNYFMLFGGVILSGGGAAVPNVWAHVALVRTNGEATLFVNGAAVATVPNAPRAPVGNFAIGVDPQNLTNEKFTGLIDEVRVFTCNATNFQTSFLLLSNTAPTYALGVGSLLEGTVAGSDSVTLGVSPSTNAWTATANAGWLHVTGTNQSGAGSANVIFSYDANPGLTRSGTISISGLTLTVTQAGTNYASAHPLVALVTGLEHPRGVAVDKSGDVFFTSFDAIGEWAANGGLSFPYGNANQAFGVATDPAGNLFIADASGVEIATNQVETLIVPEPGGSAGVAVDRLDNIYIADTSSNAVEEFPAPAGPLAVQASGGMLQPYGVAVDVARNVFIADYGNVAIDEISASNGVSFPLIASSFHTPEAVAVDGSGNLYVADTQNALFDQWTPAARILSVFAQGGPIVAPQGAAVDDLGDVFFSDSSANAIFEVPHAFVTTLPQTVPAGAVTNSLALVLPPAINLNALVPTNDVSWLTVLSTSGGTVNFSTKTNNTGVLRTGHINIFGQSVPIVQQIIGTPPVLTNLAFFGANMIQFTFTNNPNASFTVLSTTNLTLPLNLWTVEGAPVMTSPGNFQFTSPANIGVPHRFYLVSTP